MLCKNTPLKIQGLNPNHKLLLFLETQHYDTQLSLSKILKRLPSAPKPMDEKARIDDRIPRFFYLNSYTIYCGLGY